MIDSYGFGYLVIDGKDFRSDLVIYPDGRILDHWKKTMLRVNQEGRNTMERKNKLSVYYFIAGILITLCFVLFTGFRLPTAPEPGGAYQFFKEKDHNGVWVFEPDTGTSKYFDLEKGEVVINSFQMESISVKRNVKTVLQKD